MKHERILCIDFGTSHSKYVLFSPNAEIISMDVLPINNAEAPYSWQRTLQHIGTCLPLAPTRIAISGHGPTMLFLSKDGTLCIPPIFWYQHSDKSRNRLTSFYLEKIAFLERQNPGLLRKTSMILPFPEYMCYLLGAEPCAALPNTTYRPFIWDAEQIEAMGLPSHVFPPFRGLSESMGRLSPEAARGYGFPSGIPIHCGATDYLMSLLGSNCLAEGKTCNRAGTSDAVNICTGEAFPRNVFLSIPHLIEGTYSSAFFLRSKDIQSLVSHIERCGSKNEFRTLLSNISQVKAIARALLVRNMLDKAAQHGQQVESIVLSGGKNITETWHQLEADITDKVLHLPALPHTELLGLLCLVRYATDMDISLQEGASRMFRIEKSYHPQPSILFKKFCEAISVGLIENL